MNQEVRIKLDVSITLSAAHSAAEVQAIIERGVRNAFPNNHKHIHSLKFAEEAELYGRNRYPRYTHIHRATA